MIRNVVPAAFLLAAAWLARAQSGPPDFSALSLDQLANVKITSFTGKQQKLSQVAGAVYVISQEQIQRSGLTSVPELLRLAPGVDVARINGNQWSVSARGFVGAYANKLLVLIDGRSIYSEVFSGVYWDLGMPILEDIDRIEVIRGPGATIWGANAVLGVINIITKNARLTKGTLVSAGGGNAEPGFGSVRAGGALGSSSSIRAYYSGTDNAPLKQVNGSNAHDGWQNMQAGFRLDGSRKKDTWMLKGDLSRTPENATGVVVSLPLQSVVSFPASATSYTGNLTGEWKRQVTETGELKLEAYYDYANRPEPQNATIETRTTDVELKYDFTAGRVHNLSAGLGDRLISEAIGNQGSVAFTPSHLTFDNQSGYAQDEMHFLNDKLLFTVGAKLEHNHFSSWGVEPSSNLLWLPSAHHSFWISTARSLRTPALFELAVQIPLAILPASVYTEGLPVLAFLTGNPNFKPESVKDYEAGYRAQLSKSFSIDIATFYNQYSNLRSFTSLTPVFELSPVPHLQVKDTLGNYSGAVGKGAEAAVAWQIFPDWKLEGSYTYNAVASTSDPSAPPETLQGSGKYPSHNKWRLQSYVNLPKSFQFDTFLYWTSAASPTSDFGPALPVPSYLRVDFRIGKKLNEHWQLSLAGQNLLQPRHLEALSEFLTAYSYVDRSVYLKCTWQR
jgi:iron complex outermembrane receptor protein